MRTTLMLTAAAMTTNRPANHKPARRRPGRLLLGATVSVAVLSLGVLALAAPAAQASQRPALAATTYPYNFSRISWTGSDEVIAATDKHGDLYYFWQASGSATWHKQLVAGATSTLAYSKPSITVAGTTVYIAAVDGAGDLYYFTKTGTAKWQQVLLASTGQPGKFQAPSITAGQGGAVMISTGNTGGQLVNFTLIPGSPTWTVQTVAFGRFGSSSITTVFDSLDSAYLGLITASSGGTLYFWWEYLATPGWNQETVASAGAAGSYTGGSITASNADIVIAAATTTGAVDSFTQPIGASGWSQQTVASSGGPYTSPQVAWTGPLSGSSASYDVITAANKAGDVDYWYVQDGSGLGWTPETVAAHSTQAVYANPGIAITSTSVVVTAINTKPGNVMYWFQGLGTNPWHKELVATG